MRRSPTDLPIEEAAADISSAVRSNSLVLVAEPGAGKSSVVPLLVGAAVDGLVVVIEPRRLAARATAERLSEQLAECGGVGDLVGLTIRGEHRVSKRTRIEVMTEAVLTARLQSDPELVGVSAVVFDEFHERNLHSDLSFAMALEVRDTIRPDLVLVVMSATLDPGPVAERLGTSVILDVPGRAFDVQTHHLRRPSARGWTDAVADATRRARAEVAGDVLVFVPGRAEIDRVTRALADLDPIGLHGGSSPATQRQVLQPSPTQQVIVATSVAETSVTLPGVEAVVDGGLLRRAQFDPVTGLGRLVTGNVTRFAADQRRGRAGRVGPGHCYRLWSREDERHLDDAVPPEIVDGDPLPVAFELARWGDPDGRQLPLLSHPGHERLAAGRRTLETLGLVDAAGALTAHGRLAGQLGLHPRVAQLTLRAALHEGPAGRAGFMLAALLDSDRWPTTPDLAAELDRWGRDLQPDADRLRRRFDSVVGRRPERPTGITARSNVAELVAAAWPDRVAAQRTSRPDHYLLASGREAALRDPGSLSGAEFLVVVEADGKGPAVTIRRAFALDRAAVLAANANDIEWVDEVYWDERRDQLRAERQQRLGAIVLHHQPLDDPPPALVADALEKGLRRRGLDLLSWSDNAVELRHRLAWLHSSDPSWPAVDDASLLDELDQWLDLSRFRSPADLRRFGVTDEFLVLLPWEQRSRLDDLAPTRLVLPTGRQRSIGYATGRPVMATRIQDLFGLDRHPAIGPTNEPLTIELLSPANRPAQVTTDLPGFWRGSYAAVRADLRGRYPKHAWPERPWEAPADGQK